MITDATALEKSARMLARRAGMYVKLTDVTTPCTDGRTLYLPVPRFDWSKKEILQWQNSCGHEIGHNMPINRDVFDLLEQTHLSIQYIPGLVLNAVDDVRNDRNRLAEYPGMVSPWVAAQEHYQTLAAERLNDIKPDSPTDTKENKILITMLCCMSAAAVRGRRKDQQRMLLDAFSSTVSRMDAIMSAWTHEIMRDHIETWRQLETAADEYQFMRTLLEDVFKLEPEDIPPPDMADCAEWADEKYGIDPDCAMAGATAPGHFTIKFDDLIDDHDQRADPERLSSSTIDYSNYSDNVDANPHTIDTTCIITEPAEDIHQWFVERTHEAIAKSNIKTLRKKATRYLHAAVQTHYRTNQKKGRFDSRKVFKLADRDIKEPLIYKTTEQNEHVNTAVSILVDASASMHGEKQYMATVAAIGMAELCRASRAAFEVAFFSDIGRNHHFLAKQFNQSYNEDRLVRMADTAYDAGCVNADADSILLAYHRLEARTESRKILIVMSDGCPSSTNGGGNPLRYAQNVVKRIETRTNVDIIGVGIDDQSVERIYQNNRVCRSIEYLPDVLLGILKHTLTIKQRTRQ